VAAAAAKVRFSPTPLFRRATVSEVWEWRGETASRVVPVAVSVYCTHIILCYYFVVPLYFIGDGGEEAKEEEKEEEEADIGGGMDMFGGEEGGDY